MSRSGKILIFSVQSILTCDISYIELTMQSHTFLAMQVEPEEISPSWYEKVCRVSDFDLWKGIASVLDLC